MIRIHGAVHILLTSAIKYHLCADLGIGLRNGESNSIGTAGNQCGFSRL